ncbi:MAG TPA: HD domain-containing protein [Pirellulaceae bacterium]|nr:HD domain-containing protein [Planctomycetaceae bacterium]HRX78235.1 HD domain-containing protein [Pirellulaceae bacterium]
MAAIDANRRILIIDDNESIHSDFCAVLARPRRPLGALDASKQALLGDSPRATAIPEFEIDSAFQGETGFELVKAAQFDGRPYSLAFVDVRMPPGWDGIETTRKLLAVDESLQIVICTAHSDYSLEDILHEFAGTGRVMLLRKPFDITETCLLATALTDKWRLTHETNQRLQRQCDQISNTRRVMSIIQGCLDELEHAHDELRGHAGLLTQRLEQRQAEIAGTRDLTMFALAQLADSRDPETGEHLLRMRAYAQLLAEHLSKHGPYVRSINRQFLAEFYRSTPLHDIGKVGIPDQILLKPGSLTRDEFEIMKRHTIIGAEALENAAKQSSFGDFLKMASVIARSHHEKFNGTGYPDGLSGKDIPLCARITAVADVFDALTSARVYKDAMPCEEARDLIVSQSGQHFDPDVIEAFVACYDKFLKVKAAVDEGDVHAGTPVVCNAHPLPLIESNSLLENMAMLTTS